MISTSFTANSLPTGLSKTPAEGLGIDSKHLKIKGISDLSVDAVESSLGGDWLNVLASQLLQDLPPTVTGGNALPSELAAKFAAWLENPDALQGNALSFQDIGLTKTQLQQLRQSILGQSHPGNDFNLHAFTADQGDKSPGLLSKEFSDSDNLTLKNILDRFGDSLNKQLNASDLSRQIPAAKDLQSILNIDNANRSFDMNLTGSSVVTPLSRANSAGGQYQHLLAVETALQQPNWQEAFNSRVIMLARDHRQLAQIHINPPELGPVEIRMSLNAEQTHVQFISQHSVVREAIEEAFPKLREMMESSGLNLGDVDVSDQAKSQSDSFAAQETVPAKQAEHVPADDDLQQQTSQQAVSIQTSLIDHYV